MHRSIRTSRNLLLTAAFVTLGTLVFTSVASADHDYLRRDFELRRIDLDQDYKARRDANKFAYYRERDALHAARRRAQRIDCRDTRAARIRAINRSLSDLSRDYHRNNRAISSWYNKSKSALRDTYNAQVRHARRAARPVVVDTVVARPHPADCSCSVCVPVVEPVIVERPETCRPPRPVHPPVPPVDSCPSSRPRDYRDGYYRDSFEQPYLDRGISPASYGRKPNSLDWASLILNLIN